MCIRPIALLILHHNSFPESAVSNHQGMYKRNSNRENCYVTTSHQISIACTVHDYYPEIKLYFRHKSENVESQTSSVWNNTDWTMNKTVTITAVPSDDPYICVASDIPGLGDHEEIAMVYVNRPPPESTTGYPVTGISTESNSIIPIT